MSQLPKPPLLNQSKNFNDMSVSDTARFSKNSMGFFGKFSEKQEDDGSVESIIRILRAYGLSSTITPIEQTAGPLYGSISLSESNNGRGLSVAISKDGNTAAIGYPEYYDGNDTVGCVFIYVKNGDEWEQQGDPLTGAGYSGSSNQGVSVSLSSNGNTLAIGGHRDNNGVGATWIFTRNGNTWIQQGSKLIGTGNVGNSEQGFAISLSSDGNTLVIGGHTDDSGLGAIWIFTRSSGIWSQQGSKLIGTGNVGNSRQGCSVSLNSNGNTLAFGGEEDDNNIGATWIFTRSSGIWSQQGSKLVGTGYVESPNQGQSVSLSSDGNTLAVGGNQDDDRLGAVWIFVRSSGVWTQQGSKLVGTGNLGDSEQGYSVSLSSDGNTLIVGGDEDCGYTSIGEDSDRGAVWYFLRSGTVWTQQGTKVVPSNTGNQEDDINFGRSVSLADTGDFIAGGPYFRNKGAAWMFKIK